MSCCFLHRNVEGTTWLMKRLWQHTINSLNGTDERITDDNSTEMKDHRLVLQALADKVALIDKRIEDLHAESMDAVTGDVTTLRHRRYYIAVSEPVAFDFGSDELMRPLKCLRAITM